VLDKKTEYDVTIDPRTGKPHAVNVTGPQQIPLNEKVTKAAPRDIPQQQHNFNDVHRQPQRKNWAPARNLHMPPPLPDGNFVDSRYHQSSWKNENHHFNDGHARKYWDNEENIMPRDMSVMVTINNDAHHIQNSAVQMPPFQHRNQDPEVYVPQRQPYAYAPNPQSNYSNGQRGHVMPVKEFGGRNHDYVVTSPRHAVHSVPDRYMTFKDDDPHFEGYQSRNPYWHYEGEVQPTYHENAVHRNYGYDYNRQATPYDYRQQTQANVNRPVYQSPPAPPQFQENKMKNQVNGFAVADWGLAPITTE